MRGGAGAAAAPAWATSDPLLRRLAGTPYSDVRLLGRIVTTLLGLTMAIADRVHPTAATARGRPLFQAQGAAAQGVLGHAIFGAMLGALVSRSARS
ncbi:MAG: hypothetical protein ACJ752_02410 [Gaiellaceae bacterium]